jgi:hypothetical protein
MIDFPIAELFDDRTCMIWLERHLHPEGFRGLTVGGPSDVCSACSVTFQHTGIRMNGNATPAAIQSTPPSATVSTNEPVIGWRWPL